MQNNNPIADRFEACIWGGAIGDAWGSSYENETKNIDASTFYMIPKVEKKRNWSITDDTQLTLATCQALCENDFSPERLSDYFVEYYRTKRVRGIGSSTLKAILELEVGQHWTQSGRRGEYAAGNGAAMRIAPFAFFKNVGRDDVYNACRITHANDEAYSGALAVYLVIKNIIETEQLHTDNLINMLIEQLPDSNVRDRITGMSQLPESVSIAEISKLGNDGYVVNSVPFAIFAALRVMNLGMENMLGQVIATGGDTDTNASIAGQIAGTIVGLSNIPSNLLEKLKALQDYTWIENIVTEVKGKL